MMITREWLKKPFASTAEEQIAKRIGPDGISPLDLAKLRSIPAEWRVQVLFNREVLGDALYTKIATRIALGAVSYCMGWSGVKEWETWAKRGMKGGEWDQESAQAAAVCAINAACKHEARSRKYKAALAAHYAAMCVAILCSGIGEDDMVAYAVDCILSVPCSGVQKPEQIADRIMRELVMDIRIGLEV